MTHETPMSDNPVSHDELIRTVDKFNFSIEALMKEEGSLSQQACVDEGRYGGREGDSHMGKRTHQDQVQHHIDHQCDDGDLNRRLGVFAGEISGRQDLDQHVGRQT